MGLTGGALTVMSGDNSWIRYGHDNLNTHATKADVSPIANKIWDTSSRCITPTSRPWLHLLCIKG